MRGAVLAGARLTKADLTRADLQASDLYGATLGFAHPPGDMAPSTLDQTNFRYAGLQSADLRYTSGSGTSFPRADAQGADFTDADLPEANFREADLRGARLNGAAIAEADFRRARLAGLTARHATLWRARFSGADLCRADLQGADVQWADFQRADLREADLRNVRDIRFARFTGARFDIHTRWPQGFSPTAHGAVFAPYRSCPQSFRNLGQLFDATFADPSYDSGEPPRDAPVGPYSGGYPPRVWTRWPGDGLVFRVRLPVTVA